MVFFSSTFSRPKVTAEKFIKVFFIVVDNVKDTNGDSCFCTVIFNFQCTILTEIKLKLKVLLLTSYIHIRYTSVTILFFKCNFLLKRKRKYPHVCDLCTGLYLSKIARLYFTNTQTHERHKQQYAYKIYSDLLDLQFMFISVCYYYFQLLFFL